MRANWTRPIPLQAGVRGCGGNKISYIISSGRPEKSIPGFVFPICKLPAWPHSFILRKPFKPPRRRCHRSQNRKGRSEKALLQSCRTCASCHSPTAIWLVSLAIRDSNSRADALSQKCEVQRDCLLLSGKIVEGTLACQTNFLSLYSMPTRHIGHSARATCNISQYA